METSEILHFLQQQIHSVVMATADDDGLPVTCAVDVMDDDDKGLYFLTAKGKGLYRRLKKDGYAALTGMHGNDTLSCTTVSIQGRLREIGSSALPKLFAKNPYMYAVYPTESSRQALTVFQMYEGSGEWFDLSKTPIERFPFSFGGKTGNPGGYRITKSCTGCRACVAACPQRCIDFSVRPAVIRQAHCLHCGNCAAVCPQKAVLQRGKDNDPS